MAADDGVVGGDVDKDDVAGLGAGADVAGYVEGDGFSFAVGDNVPLERERFAIPRARLLRDLHEWPVTLE